MQGLAREGEALGRTIETLYALVSASNPSFDSTQALLQNVSFFPCFFFFLLCYLFFGV